MKFSLKEALGNNSITGHDRLRRIANDATTMPHRRKYAEAITGVLNNLEQGIITRKIKALLAEPLSGYAIGFAKEEPREDYDIGFTESNKCTGFAIEVKLKLNRMPKKDIDSLCIKIANLLNQRLALTDFLDSKWGAEFEEAQYLTISFAHSK